MELFSAIKSRYSYRGVFRQETVPEAHLRVIVQAGLDAPTGNNKQTPLFIAVTDPKLIGTIAGILNKEKVKTAPVIIVIFADPQEKYHLEDCAAACQNCLLSITALGYASCWIDGALRREDRAEKIAGLLKIPAPYRIHIVLPLGVAEEEGKRKAKKAFPERAWFNRFGSSH
jgi:nitroreductase